MFIIPSIEPVAFHLFGLPIYWYGIIMAFGIFVAMICANHLFNKINTDIRKDIIIEYAPWLIFAGIIGARLYFCALNPHYYITHPIEILDIRQGGLSIHGAVIGGILSIIFVAKKSKIPILSIADSLACATILGQAIGRWGNYFNSEAYGIPTENQNWGLFIPEKYRIANYTEFNLFHPTFLYESIANIIAFIILLYIYKKFGRKYRGITLFSYFTIYAVIRFFIEQIRVDSALNIGSFPIAQIVSIILFIIGFIGIITIILNKNSVKKH
ncbi:prolipoprotein diacylglyceryl transferase [bacterium]|nr:prolipoprotein diacylglyceryl transferase [bacterium]MBQ9246012.1 prolipoprotein diacylglyceryl transferase [bacterium]MBQ9246885.1 prolipoprotein diacylglyceryl transferase [bacterium]